MGGIVMAVKPLSRTTRQLQDEQTKHAVNAVKMVSLLALRDQGWGESRLRKFSNKFNDIVEDVSHGYLTLTDIADTIYDETGLSMKELRVE
jgi:hypothetical protein